MAYAPVNGQEIYYEVRGSGRPLVLLHGGLLTIGLTFGELLPALARTRRVIALELQGHGHTADIEREFTVPNLVSDVVGVLDHLDVEEADVFGFSLGGIVALQLAMSAPERVGRVVAAAVHARHDGYHPDIFGMVPESTRLPTEADFKEMQEAYAAVAPFPEQFESFAAKASALPETHEWTPGQLAAVRVPVLLLVGDNDFVRVEHAAEMHALIPDARLAVLPDTTHMDLTKRADLVLPMVGRFLNQ